MKKLKLHNKFIFLINVLVAFLLLVSYLLYYVPPQKFAVLSVLSLSVPLLIILNIFFCLFWLLKLKKQLLLSLLMLLFGYRYINAMYNFSETHQKSNTDGFAVMNYNVRLFNVFNWLPSQTVKTDILQFINKEQPDILSLQEYHEKEPLQLAGYEAYKVFSKGQVKSGQAIFSKSPIINSGSVAFPKTSNNAIYVDVKRHNDTIRVYNIHLQSSGINTEVETLDRETSGELFDQVGETFKIQQSQVELVLKHLKQCPYKTIITGDFNNTAYSYVYRKLKGNFKDAFIEAGQGFGRTYDFKFFPMRIDFILVDAKFEIYQFDTFKEKFSDHYPIKAILN